MTVQHIGMVYAADGGLEANEKHLLGAYCNHTDAHGYCWPGIDRLMDETGMSRSTVKRVNKSLKAKNLIKSVRRVSKAGEPISNLTRVNLPLLESMKRPHRGYNDNLIEAITFDEESTEDSLPVASKGSGTSPKIGSDLLMVHSDPYPGSDWTLGQGQSEPDLGFNLNPKTSLEPSDETSPPTPRNDLASPESQPPLRNEGGGGEVFSNEDKAALVTEVRALRPEWAATSIAKVLDKPGVIERGNPALIRAALLLVARDQQSQAPGRLAFDGPWWSRAAATLRKPGRSHPDLPPRCDDPRHDPYLLADRVLYDDEAGPFPCPTCHPTAIARRSAR